MFLSGCKSDLTLTLGVRIEYLPPYSPDLNPVKEAFSKIKHWICCHQDYYSKTTDGGILYDMYEALDIITPNDTKGYFMHVGYF
jgi:DDE superfamily endonuclease